MTLRVIGGDGFELVIPPNRLARAYQSRRNVTATCVMAAWAVVVFALAVHAWSSAICLSIGFGFPAVMVSIGIGYLWRHPTIWREAEPWTTITFDGKTLRCHRPPRLPLTEVTVDQIHEIQARRLPFSRCGEVRVSAGKRNGFSAGWYRHRDLVPVIEEVRRRMGLPRGDGSSAGKLRRDRP